MVCKALLDELKTIIQEDYNVNLTDSEVEVFGNTLVSLFDVFDKTDLSVSKGCDDWHNQMESTNNG